MIVRGFEDHILQIRPTLRAEDVWVQHEAEYLDWFRSKVIQDKPNDDVLFALAMGPSTLVRTWNGYYVNGYNFQTQGSSKHKSTMNYGVCVSNDGGSDFFGILDDVIELKFTGALRQYNTILFKCNWMDNVRGMNIDQYKLVEVNHTKKYPKFDPFVLSYQVSQVYFAPYPSLKRDRAQWWAVFRTKARSVIDAPVDFDFLQETSVGTPTLSDPSDIPDYEEGNDVECVQADDEEFYSKSPQ
ncbi:uncharacterized protein LOC125492892 [Beta vulgaris subsp. vulgaris]|uniref:uncharacterized protein LOC125492892 n=1 Tax=Beta vulgaris subsp. vulgaris TaxID=3555 RepID=UPI0025479671|nr:uncharacterized protein LOC125492892 [Beta vulgaris subsp. vulgaris]